MKRNARIALEAEKALVRKWKFNGKIEELKQRMEPYDEWDWQYWELQNMIYDLQGYGTSASYVRPESLTRFLNDLNK